MLVKDRQPGKWLAGSGLLVMGILFILAGLSLGFENSPLYFVLIPSGLYVAVAVIHDQLIKNISIYFKERRSKQIH